MENSHEGLIASPNPRPSTSNPKLRNFTTSPVAGWGSANHTPNTAHHGATQQQQGTNPLPQNANAALASLKELDPTILWSTEADVPIGLLARPGTSNPRYVEGLMASQNASSVVSPTAQRGGNMMNYAAGRQSNATSPSPQPFRDANTSPMAPQESVALPTTAAAAPTAPVLWSDSIGGVDPSLLARPVTANPWLQRVFDSVERPADEPPLLAYVDGAQGGGDDEEGIIATASVNIGSDASAGSPHSPFSAPPPMLKQTHVGPSPREEEPTAAENVTSGGNGVAVRTTSTRQHSPLPQDEGKILWAAASDGDDWRLLARPTSSNPILERNRSSREEALATAAAAGTATIEAVVIGGSGDAADADAAIPSAAALEPAGSYTMWSREEANTNAHPPAAAHPPAERRCSQQQQQPCPSCGVPITVGLASSTPRQHQHYQQQQLFSDNSTVAAAAEAANMRRIIAHQSIELAAMRARVEALEGLCAAAGLLLPNNNSSAATSNGEHHHGYDASLSSMVQRQGSDLVRTAARRLSGGGHSSDIVPGAAALSTVSPYVLQAPSASHQQQQPVVAGADLYANRPRTAVPNDPSVRLPSHDRRPSRGRSGDNQHAPPPPPSTQSIPVAFANAERVATPPPDVCSAAIGASPPAGQSPLSFGGGNTKAEGGGGREVAQSPSPVRLVEEVEASLCHNEVAHPLAEVGDEEEAGNRAGSAYAAGGGRPRTAAGPRRPSPPAGPHPPPQQSSAPEVEREATDRQLRIADDDDPNATFEAFDVDAEEMKEQEKQQQRQQQEEKGVVSGGEKNKEANTEKDKSDETMAKAKAHEDAITAWGIPERPMSAKDAARLVVDPPHPTIPTPTVDKRPRTGSEAFSTISLFRERPASASSSAMAAAAAEEDIRPRSANRVIPPIPPNIVADIREGRPSSKAAAYQHHHSHSPNPHPYTQHSNKPNDSSDAYVDIREDNGALSVEDEDAVERSFSAKGYRRSPSAQNRYAGAPSGGPIAQRTVQFGIGPTPLGGAFNTGMSMPPRPESALPSRRAARLRMVVGQCRPTTAPSSRGNNGEAEGSGPSSSSAGVPRGEAVAGAPAAAPPQRPSTAQVRGGSMNKSNPYAQPVSMLNMPPSAADGDGGGGEAPRRRCASAGLSRPFLATTAKHLGATDGKTYGRQRDNDIRKEYANILRQGEHAVTKDDFKALYTERAAEFGMRPSDSEVEDLMAPFYKEGIDHLSLDEFGVLFLKMSAW